MYAITFSHYDSYDSELTGIIGYNATVPAMILKKYDGTEIVIPYANFMKMEARLLSDEEIAACGDEGFIAWYGDMKARVAAKQAKEEAEQQ